MAREHYYGRQRGVNAANGHNDKRNGHGHGHLDTRTGRSKRRGGTEGGRGVTCIKLLIRFVGSREGRRVGRLCGRLKVCKGRVFYCGTKNLSQRMNCGAPQPIVKVGGAAVVAVVAAAASSCALVS